MTNAGIEIIECVPNFSTSNPKTVRQILAEIEKVDSAYLLDHSFDDYYNRLVVTMAGNKRAVLEAALSSSMKAVELIDMNTHKGQHPRIGAVDVVPFVPVKMVSMQDCVEVAKKYAQIFSGKSGVPVYLYGEAASQPERRDIDWIRMGEYEKLSEMIHLPERKPDFGPATPHPSAGATIAGARGLMVGFNVNLGTDDVEIGKAIARAIHGKKGGLASVRAMCAKVPQKRQVQIGMSIYDFERTPLYRVLELLRVECQRFNVPILDSEINGVIPLKAVMDATSYYLKLSNLAAPRILETGLAEAIERKQK